MSHCSIRVSRLRTSAESVLYPVAIVMSALLWVILAFAVFAPPLAMILGLGSSHNARLSVTVEEPCIYSSGDAVFYVKKSLVSSQELKNCIERKNIPDSVYTEAKAAVNSQNNNANGAANASKATKAAGSFVLLFYAVGILLFIFISTALAVAHIRLNGVKIGSTQYPQFYEIYLSAAEKLGLKKIPDAYIIQAGGVLNAFAIKIAFKKVVVFYAELVEELVSDGKWDELRAVAGHELTHVRLRHIYYWFFLLPFRLVPFLGKMFSRAREVSADRGAFAVVGSHLAVEQALVKLATGKFVAAHINVDQYVQQPKTEHGLFIWLARLVATHPPIPYRIQNVRKLTVEMFQS